MEAPAAARADGLPRTIWTYWHQGWDAAPPLMRRCLEQMQHHHPAWTVRALDGQALEGLVPAALVERAEPTAAFSDRLRLELLATHGGVWLDATVYCMRSLDTWLPSLAESGFFAFRLPTAPKPIASWCLASVPEGQIVTRWNHLCRDYWEGRSEYDTYFWVHGLFAGLLSSDPVVAGLFASMPSLSAEGPHYFAPYRSRLLGPMTRRARWRLASRRDPLYKLRKARRRVPDDSVLQAILSRNLPSDPPPRLGLAMDVGLEWCRQRGRSVRLRRRLATDPTRARSVGSLPVSRTRRA